MDSKNIMSAKAYANIAIIKYWGKKDEKKKIPCNSSISFTLKEFFTLTSIKIDDSISEDKFYLNGELQSEEETKKVSKMIDYFREQNQFVIVKSRNSMPTAAGLSSSSSGLAALVICANAVFNKQLTDSQLSYIARLGSGSACRSLYGPLAIWKTSEKDEEAIAYPVSCELDLSMIVIILNSERKKVLSRNGMLHCKNTSTTFSHWISQANQDAQEMLRHIKNNDFNSMGNLMQKNTLLMHSTTLTSNPPFTYLNEDTHQCLNFIHQLQSEGLEVYYTMDAGPNVKLLCQSKDANTIHQKLLQKYNPQQIIISQGASGYELYDSDIV